MARLSQWEQLFPRNDEPTNEPQRARDQRGDASSTATTASSQANAGGNINKNKKALSQSGPRVKAMCMPSCSSSCVDDDDDDERHENSGLIRAYDDWLVMERCVVPSQVREEFEKMQAQIVTLVARLAQKDQTYDTNSRDVSNKISSADDLKRSMWLLISSAVW